MTRQTYPYRPDYAVPPGWVLEERIEAQGISPEELAVSCGIAPKLVNGIMAGEAPIDAETAEQLSRVLGLHTEIWLGIEADYRDFVASPRS